MKHRKLLAAALALLFCPALIGCGSNGTLGGQSAPTDPAPSAAPAQPAPSPPCSIYIQDDQLYYAAFSDTASAVRLGSQLFAEDVTDRDNWTGYLSVITKVSGDGTKVLYPQCVSNESYSLYYWDMADPTAEALLVDTGLSTSWLQMYFDTLAVNDAFDRIIYLHNGNLYRHDLKEKTLIASDVEQFQTSADGKKLWFLTGDDRLYLWQDGGQPEVIAGGVTGMLYINESMDIFFCKKGDALWTWQKGQSEKLLTSEVYSFHGLENGAAYYTVEQGQVRFSEFFGDNLTSQFRDAYLDSPFQTLYYFDGTESAVINSFVLNLRTGAAGGSAILYSAVDLQDIPFSQVKPYLNQLEESRYKLQDDFLEENRVYYVADREKAGKVPIDNMDSIYNGLSADGKILYTGAYAEDNSYSIYELTLDGAQITGTRTVDENIAQSAWTRTADGKYIAYKDISDYTIEGHLFQMYAVNYNGSLYLDGKHIEDLVRVDAYQYSNGNLFYITDWDDALRHGTLKLYDGEKTDTLIENIYGWILTPEGDLLILSNRSEIDGPGELWVYSEGELRYVADNVMGLIDIY